MDPHTDGIDVRNLNVTTIPADYGFTVTPWDVLYIIRTIVDNNQWC